MFKNLLYILIICKFGIVTVRDKQYIKCHFKTHEAGWDHLGSVTLKNKVPRTKPQNLSIFMGRTEKTEETVQELERKTKNVMFQKSKEVYFKKEEVICTELCKETN